MKRNVKLFILVVVAAVFLAPAVLGAQGELTLESLAEKIENLTGRVSELETRVTDVEAVSDTDYCTPSVTSYHPMTLAGIAEELPVYETQKNPELSFVQVNLETGEMVVRWQTQVGFMVADEIVLEYYGKNCQWTAFQFKAGGQKK